LSCQALQWRCIRPLVLQPGCVVLGLRPVPESNGGITYEVDHDFLDHARREACEGVDVQDAPAGLTTHHYLSR